MTPSNVESAATPSSPRRTGASENAVLCKVPQVTVYFWVIKVLCTTVGETVSDFLNVNLGLGLKGTSVAAGLVLAIALFFQFKSKKYLPAVYWLTVVLISVFGTLVTDILTDSLHVPLEATTVLFSGALALTFGAWYAREGTLSIHSIFTPRRETFYWLAILFTFALGTASGDLMAEKLGLGYLVTGLIVVGVIVASTIAWRFGLDAVLAFWIAYILTRPLGASLGDYLSQSRANGGLGLGATITSAGFLLAILAVVVFLAVTRKDFISESPEEIAHPKKGRAAWQVVIVAVVLVTAGGTGYHVRQSQLRTRAAASVSATAPLGDLTAFRQIAGDMLRFVRAGDMPGARARADDLETAWDNGQALMRPMNPQKWTRMDQAIDDVLTKVRSGRSSAAEDSASLSAFIHVMDTIADVAPQSARPALQSGSATQALPGPTTQAQSPGSGVRPLGDLSAYRTIATDLLRLVHGGDMSGARLRAHDLESAWDDAQARLQPSNPAQWTVMDGAIDNVLRTLRSAQPSMALSSTSLGALIVVIDRLDPAPG